MHYRSGVEAGARAMVSEAGRERRKEKHTAQPPSYLSLSVSW